MEPTYWVVSAGIALIPGILYALGFYLADIYEREPYLHVFGAFLWGAVPALIIAALFNQSLDSVWLQDNPILAIGLVGPFVEESLKVMAVAAIYLLARQEFDGPLDGLVYGALVGFGFAMTENISYFVIVAKSQGWVQWLSIVLLRVVVFGLSHATYTALGGIGLGLARHSSTFGRKAVFVLSAWLLAIGLHGAHNLAGQFGGLTKFIGVGLALVNLFGIYIAFQRSYWLEVNIIKKELFEEIGVILSQDEYSNLTLGMGRPSLLDSPDRRQSARLRLAVELANRKHRLSTMGVQREPELPAEISGIREQVAALS